MATAVGLAEYFLDGSVNQNNENKTSSFMMP